MKPWASIKLWTQFRLILLGTLTAITLLVLLRLLYPLPIQSPIQPPPKSVTFFQVF